MELFASRCPADAAPLLPGATELALELLSYDPNFAEDEVRQGFTLNPKA
jgi:hypothetical protein